MTEDEMESAWNSNITSEMQEVAFQALDNQNPTTARIAERVIIKSALNGSSYSQLVNYPLIKVAFDDRWQMFLTQNDKRATLLIALDRLLGDKAYNINYSELNPGVLLGIIATLPSSPVINKLPAQL